MYKICSVCKLELSLDLFYSSKKTKDGKMPACKECTSIRSKQYYKKHRQHRLDKVKEYTENNKEKINKYQKEYREKNRENNIRYQRNRYRTKKESYKRYSIEHRDSIRRNARKRSREIYRGNRGEFYLLKMRVRKLIGVKIRLGGYTKKSEVSNLLKCSWKELQKWLGPKPPGEAHIDHICPCNQAKTEEEFLKLQHYTNLRWISAIENLEKGDNKTEEAEIMCMLLLNRDWID